MSKLTKALDKKEQTFKQPLSMVDTVIFTVLDQHLQVLLVKRAIQPFENEWSLVGGLIDTDKDESLESTAKRKLFEKTGIKTPYLEQVECIGNAHRDPRGWSITHIYFALLSHERVNLQHGAGANDIRWSKLSKNRVKEKLAFDHRLILEHAVQRLRNKVLYTSLPIYLMPKKFTLRSLQNVYEIILGEELEHKSFRRRILNAGILEETDEYNQERGRPAKIYTTKNNQPAHYFNRMIEGGR